jgi:RNA polymerase sigma-70 factor (ECF subfamily)
MFEPLGVYEGQMASDFSVELPLPLTPPADEADLVARALRGDHDAYADLVRPHERVAFRVAAAITGWNADAEEATQNGFVKAYRSLARFRSGAAFRPWLLKIVVNEAHNVVRARRRHERLGARAAELHEASGASADEAVLARDEVETVLSALAGLAEADRLVVVLRYFAELPDIEAAALAETSPEAYRVRLMRARRRLQALLEEADG